MLSIGEQVECTPCLLQDAAFSLFLPVLSSMFLELQGGHPVVKENAKRLVLIPVKIICAIMLYLSDLHLVVRVLLTLPFSLSDSANLGLHSPPRRRAERWRVNFLPLRVCQPRQAVPHRLLTRVLNLSKSSPTLYWPASATAAAFSQTIRHVSKVAS